MTFAVLHQEFEGLTHKGVGAAISLKQVQNIAQGMLSRLSQKKVDGLNQNIPLTPIRDVKASFEAPASSFLIDPANGTLSCKISITLHVAGDPSGVILTYDYEIVNAAIVPSVDQAEMKVYLEPDPSAVPALAGETIDPNAGQRLVTLGYVDAATGAADWNRFNREVVYPYLWINSRGLMRAVYRSIPLPQPLAWLQTITALPPIESSVRHGYLMAWSKKAAVRLPFCGTPASQGPKNKNWQGKAGVPLPWSPMDPSEPPVVLYYGASPILDWHAELVSPGVFLKQEQDGILGWGIYGAVGVARAQVDFIPSSTGGSIEASMDLDVLGHATAWATGPCGVRIDVITTTVTAQGDANGAFEVEADVQKLLLKAKLSIQCNLRQNTINLSSGGLFGTIYVEIVEWLIKTGILRINTGFGDRSESVLLELDHVNIPWPRVAARVAENSVAYALLGGG